MTPLEFLTQLWQHKPEEHFVLIWTTPEKRSRWFTDISAAADYVTSINGDRDVYVGVGLSKADYGPTRRCKSDEISGLCGIGVDLDVKSEAHGNKPLPPSIDDALSLLPPTLSPSILVSTGNGVHAWWLLKEPFVLDTEDDRKLAVSVLARWHTMLRLRAATRGWAYDRLSDLARILRVPGTLNHKDPNNRKKVAVLSATDLRYNMSDFEELLDDTGIPDPEAEEKARREWAERFADKPLVINVSARIQQQLLDEWINQDPRFRNTWERRRHDLKDQSDSGYDMALACFGVDAGLSEQRIVDLVVHHRALHGRKQRTRVDYFQRTIAKAMEKAGGAPAVTVGAPASGAHDPRSTDGNDEDEQQPADPAIAKAYLCETVSAALSTSKFRVQIIRMVKFQGKEPTYHMELIQGKIEFPSFAKFTDYASVRNAIGGLTNGLIRKIKTKEWEPVAQMMLDACFIEECTEEEEFEGGARANVLDYLQETDFIPSIEGQRVQDQRRPMIADGRILVSSSDFKDYLNRTKNLGISGKAAASMLGAIGAKKSPRLRSNKYRSQSRWALPPADFNPAEIKPSAVAAGDIHDE
ncbi:MAG: hypothetical protein IT165_25465 [Bryobacterales bacterium]|nr:hypothetical protein [Bryobacterales bacterium]